MFVAYNLYANTCSYYTTAYVCARFILPVNLYCKNAGTVCMLLAVTKKILVFTTGYVYIKTSFAYSNYLLPNSFYLWKT